MQKMQYKIFVIYILQTQTSHTYQLKVTEWKLPMLQVKQQRILQQEQSLVLQQVELSAPLQDLQ
jgi:hypothetical protein